MKNDKFYYLGEEYFLKSCNYRAFIYFDEEGEYFLRPHNGYFEWNEYPKTLEDANKAFHAHFALLKEMGFNAIRLMGSAVEPSWAEDKLCIRVRFDNESVLPTPMLTAKDHKKFEDRPWQKLYYLEEGGTEALINSIRNMLDIAQQYDLKVMWVTGRDTRYYATIEDYDNEEPTIRSLLQPLNHTITNQYIEYLEEIATAFKDHPALFSYDLFHELKSFNNETSSYLEDGEQIELSEVIKEINHAVKFNAPNHYTTVGFVSSRQFMQLGVKPFYHVDFYNFHLYDYPKALENNNPGDYVNREMYFLYKTIDKPWMVGEIGIQTDPENSNFSVNEIEQREFALRTIEQTLNCSNLGYAWWEYKDHSNYQSYGLLKRDGEIPINIPLQENPYDVHGTYKKIVDPALGSVFKIEMSTNECIFDNDLYRDIFSTPADGNYTFSGTVKDSIGNPIANAMIHFKARDSINTLPYPERRYTFTDSDGEFEISFNDREVFHNVAVTKYGYSTNINSPFSHNAEEHFTIHKINYPEQNSYPIDIIIYNDETVLLDFKRFVLGNIIIEDGGTLIISDSIFFNEQSRILVKPGAKILLQEGAVLTAINNSWHGVVLQGYPNVSSKPELISYSNTTISKAFQAVNSNFGTKINMSGTTFLNNYEDVYINNSENNPIVFTNCNFIISSDAMPQFSASHSTDEFVRLINVHDVKFTNCKFFDYRETSEQAPYKIGISAYNVRNLEVLPAPLASDIHKSSFNNLKYGVKAITSAASKINVVKADFKTSRGIYLNGYMGANNIRLINNNFIIKDYIPTIPSFVKEKESMSSFREIINPGDPNYPGEDYTRPYGIYVDGTAINYHIEGNYFTSDGDKTDKFGVVLKNNWQASNEIYRNRFNELENSVQAIGLNRNLNTTIHTGVEILCNTFTNSNIDVFVTDGDLQFPPNYGISQLQGSSNKPAGNLFSTNGDFVNINNEKAGFTYFHRNQNDPEFVQREVPEVMGSVGVFGIDETEIINNLCPDNTPSRPFPGDAFPVDLIAELQIDMFSSYTNETNITNFLRDAVDGGNTENLLNQISAVRPNTYLNLCNNLLSYAPYLSDTVLIAFMQHDFRGRPNQKRDVLLACSPMSAKAQKELENTWLPPPFKAQVLSQQSGLSHAEIAIIEKSEYRKQYNKALYNLCYIYSVLSDSLPHYRDSVAELLSHRDEAVYRNMLADFYASNLNYSDANYVLNSIIENFELSVIEHKQTLDLIEYFEFLEQMIADSIDIFDLVYSSGGHSNRDESTNEPRDTAQVDTLVNRRQIISQLRDFESRGGPAGYRATAVLMINNLSRYSEPIYLPTEIVTPRSTMRKPITPQVNQFSIYPNPAEDYIIVEFNNNDYNDSDLHLIISDITGRVVLKENLRYTIGEVVINTTKLQKSMYNVSILKEQVIIYNTRVVIGK